MQLPQGLHTYDPSLVCKLEKSLYGLKQASRQWNAKLTQFLSQSGYTQSKADYSLFTKSTPHSFTAILVYVDDLVLARTNITEITLMKELLDRKFSIKDLGDLKYFLGFEIARSNKGINLCQRKYAVDLLNDTGMLPAKPCSTPMDSKLRLHKNSGEPFSDPSSYRKLIGRLPYLTHTRPDISFAVSNLSQFLDSPTTDHHQAAMRIIRYIKGSPGNGLFFPASSETSLKGFSDSDWGTCPDSRKSITGFFFFLVLLWFHGRVRNKQPFQGLLLK